MGEGPRLRDVKEYVQHSWLPGSQTQALGLVLSHPSSRDSVPRDKEWCHPAWVLRPLSPWSHGDTLGAVWCKNFIRWVQLGHWLWKESNFYLYSSSKMWVHFSSEKSQMIKVSWKTPRALEPSSTPSLLTSTYTVNCCVHACFWSSVSCFWSSLSMLT